AEGPAGPDRPSRPAEAGGRTRRHGERRRRNDPDRCRRRPSRSGRTPQAGPRGYAGRSSQHEHHGTRPRRLRRSPGTRLPTPLSISSILRPPSEGPAAAVDGRGAGRPASSPGRPITTAHRTARRQQGFVVTAPQYNYVVAARTIWRLGDPWRDLADELSAGVRTVVTSSLAAHILIDGRL